MSREIKSGNKHANRQSGTRVLSGVEVFEEYFDLMNT